MTLRKKKGIKKVYEATAICTPAVIKMLRPEYWQIDVHINSHPFAVSNYKDVASNGRKREEKKYEGRGLLNTLSPYRLYVPCVQSVKY